MKGIINWAAPNPTTFQGKKFLKFKIGREFISCNDPTAEDLKILKEGNEVEFSGSPGTAVNPRLIKLGKPTKKKDDFMTKIQGKDYMTYPGLLDKAHSKDAEFSMIILESFVSEDMKRAWCKVRLTSGNQTFDGFGSSTPENTGKMTENHPIEICHTRAKGRAMRDFVNYGIAMAEELNPTVENTPVEPPKVAEKPVEKAPEVSKYNEPELDHAMNDKGILE